MTARNVILLTIDTLRKDALGCYGHPLRLTPFIDSLQARCLRFSRAQAVGPYTQASFPGILTSSYYLDYGPSKTLSPRRTLVCEPLKQAGVVTAAFHSNPYLSDYFGWNRGWDTFYDSMDAEVSDEVPYIRGDAINAKVDAWLFGQSGGGQGSREGSGAGSPFFLWAHYMDIHEPYVPARNYLDMVDPTITLAPAEMFALFKDVLLKRDASNPQTVELLRKLYLAKVREIDDYVKQFFDILARRGVLKDSTVIVTSDHGDEFGEHGGLSHDGKMHAELLDVPLFIYQADRPGEQRCDKLVSNLDIAPTILHLFGLPPALNFQGRSLLPAADYPDRPCYGEAIEKKGRQKETDQPIYYGRDGDLKVVYHRAADAWELYDLAADPREQHNVIASHPRAEAMKELLRPRISRTV